MIQLFLVKMFIFAPLKSLFCYVNKRATFLIEKINVKKGDKMGNFHMIVPNFLINPSGHLGGLGIKK